MIISGGENIHPGEIEDLLFSHSCVDDVAVTGADDTRWGQIVKAFVVKKDPNLTAEQLDEFFRESHLESYKRPRAYEFIAEIPRNPSRKIPAPPARRPERRPPLKTLNNTAR